MEKKKRKAPGGTTEKIIFCAAVFAAGIVPSAVAALISHFLPKVPFAVWLVIVCIAGAATALAVYLKYNPMYRSRLLVFAKSEYNNIFDILKRFPEPALLADDTDNVVWFNSAFTEISEEYGKKLPSLAELFPVDLAALKNEQATGDLQFGDRYFRCYPFRLEYEDSYFTLVIFKDTTDCNLLHERYEADRAAVLYIHLDNLDDLQDDSRTAENSANTVIKRFADSLGGILKEYERNKYLVIIRESGLLECVKNKFSVLDDIRNIRISGERISLTASVGASDTGSTLSEIEASAFEALKHSFERGGDQAVVRSDNGKILYFGGVSQTARKMTKVRSRVFANEFMSAVSASSNVLLSGHKRIDYDAIGACVGLARMVMHAGVKVNIIADLSDPNIEACREYLSGLPEYDEVFISEDDAFDTLSPDTLLVFADVNNPRLFEASRLSARVDNIVFIDHHRKVLDFDFSSARTYIEASASSACELVSEMAEQILPGDTLRPAEADLMLAGIQLDTKKFTKATGPRTFGAALYLRSCGANPENITGLFDTEIEEMKAEADFESSAIRYEKHPNIAIAASDRGTPLTAARVADKLLEIKGVDASFTLLPAGDVIHLSARSKGKVNVQHIAEKLGGGGRFEEAGAQLGINSLNDAAEELRRAIDEYFSELDDSESD